MALSSQRHTRGNRSSLARRLLIGVLVAGFSLLLALVVGEILLRVLPVPGIELQPFYYDESTGGKLYPGSSLSYRSARGDFVKRRINSWGFLDVEHEIEKPPGTIRVGFFGDSYTESRQVEIDETFFRQIESDLRARGRTPAVETLAFGVAGRSTVQSWFECLEWMERADLDHVVYVFCENDPGDHLEGVSQADVAPFASLEGDSLVIDVSFRDTYAHRASPLYRAAQYLKARSLVISTIVSRLKLLRRHGIQLPPSGDGAGVAGETIMGPASWPSDSLAVYGWAVTGRVIESWNRDVTAAGRHFAILRVPRAIEIEKPLAEQDAFAPRLHSLCDSLGIPLIDPTERLLTGRHSGREMYYDHFTPAGHRAVAETFVEWLDEWEASEDPRN